MRQARDKEADAPGLVQGDGCTGWEWYKETDVSVQEQKGQCTRPWTKRRMLQAVDKEVDALGWVQGGGCDGIRTRMQMHQAWVKEAAALGRRQ